MPSGRDGDSRVISEYCFVEEKQREEKTYMNNSPFYSSRAFMIDEEKLWYRLDCGSMFLRYSYSSGSETSKANSTFGGFQAKGLQKGFSSKRLAMAPEYEGVHRP
jgi:hypothetical protein